MKESKKYTEANRKAWNEAMPKHRTAMNEKWDGMFSQKDFVYQKGAELEELKKLKVKGKRIAHLSCNNGIELMSLKRMGADICVGFDISDEAILDARKRADKFKIECEFVRTDVLEIPECYYDCFDIVYITVGALVWIPDLNGYFEKASKLLVKGGKIFIYEHHPFASVFPYDGESDDPLKAKYNYFSNEIGSYNDGIDYYGGTVYDSSTSYEFSYTLSDLLGFLIDTGLEIKKFNEYLFDIALGNKELEDSELKLPLSYILIGEKK